MKILQRSWPLLCVSALATGLQAQHVSFSVDWRSPSVGLPDSALFTPITAGDILFPAAGVPMLGPLAVPSTGITHGPGGLGLLPGCVGMPGGIPCPAEVDAFSFGVDDVFSPGLIAPGHIQWSVDTFAFGMGPVFPNVTSEAPVGDSASDIFLNVGPMPPLPAGPGAPVRHRGLFDGDGLPSGTGFAYYGLGLIEPSPPVATPLAGGDNVDAIDLLTPGGVPGLISYFSLDSVFPDPLTGLPAAMSAVTNGFAGGDVLQSTPGLAPVLYAPAPALGLDFFGVHSDDLDALILWENGDGMFTPSQMPFDWIGGGTDMLLFSVRRGSAVIGMPDSILGVPIEEGDILTTPLPVFLGGVSPFPGLMVAGEKLGLGTIRSGTAMGFFADDLDGLDYRTNSFNDCDMDGMEDVVAIAMGLVTDANMNGIPDSCEFSTPCTPLPNSTGFPTVMTGAVTGSPGTGFHLEATSGPPTEFGYFLIGTGTMSPGLLVGSGLLCLDTGGLISRYNVATTVMNSIGQFNGAGVMVNLVGTSTVGTGFDVPTPIPTPIGGTIMAGDTWHFQLWHRDMPSTSNFSNVVSHTF